MKRSENFGPLRKEEKIKRIDARGQWVQVWIPRLRVSGWVPKSKVSEISEKTSDPDGISLDVLNTVTVISSRANIRSAPNMNASKIHLAKRKQRFVALSERNGWYQIWMPHLEKKGWINGKIVTRSPKE